MSLRKEREPGRLSDVNEDALRELVEFNAGKNIQEFSLDLNTSQYTIFRHFKKIGNVRNSLFRFFILFGSIVRKIAYS